MKKIFLLAVIAAFSLPSPLAFSATHGFVSLKGGKLRVDYADGARGDPALSEGLKDYISLLQLEGTLKETVANGSGTIEIYELNTGASDLRLGGVIYRDHNKTPERRILKIEGPLTDEIFADFGLANNFLHLKGQAAARLWELCQKHGQAGKSEAIHYDFGGIACNKDRVDSSVSCVLTKL